MKKLCFSSYFKVLSQAKIKINDEDLFKFLIGPFFNDEYGYSNDKGTIGKYKKGGGLPGPLGVAASTVDLKKLVTAYSNELVRNLVPTKKSNIILAIQDLLFSDSSLADNTVIGDNLSYTKKTIIDRSFFDLPELLANTTIFCLKIPNEATSLVDNTYLNSFNSRSNEINFAETPLLIDLPLDSTVKKELFNNTFIEIPHKTTFSTPNESIAKIYCLNLRNKSFDYSNINDFIKKNIGRYVFSRAKRNDYKINDDEDLIALDAVKELKKNKPSLNLGDHFAEIMIYSFLESALNAPKIFSKIELGKMKSSFNSTSSGVHLLASYDTLIKNHQLAFGASNVLNDLRSSADAAFQQINDIVSDIEDEIDLIESSILDNTFDAATTNYLKNIIIPSKKKISKPETSFGVFLAYSISLSGSETLSNTDFNKFIQDKIETDIITIIPYLEKSIKDNSFDSYSFYFYVLPLIDAENDKNEIMNSALGV